MSAQPVVSTHSVNLVKALIVDHDESVSLKIHEQLNSIKDYAFDIEIVGSFSEAQKKIYDTHFDVCLAEYDLTPHTGLELADFAKRHHLDTKLILLSDNYEKRIDDQAFQLGVREYFCIDDINARTLAHSVQNIFRERYNGKVEDERLYYDTSGLLNSFLFFDRFVQIINRISRSKETLSLIYINVKDLDHIDTEYGSGIGRKYADILAEKLRFTIRDYDVLGQLDKHEFCILLDGTYYENASLVIDKLRDLFSKPFSIDNLTIHPCIGFGLTALSGNQIRDPFNVSFLEEASKLVNQAKENEIIIKIEH